MSERFIAVIPAYNAAPMVGAVIAEARAQIAEVVVVDDGSIDETGGVARDAGAVVLTHDANRGKGAALKTGFRYALERGFDGVITLDADGQHLAREISAFIRAREETGADLIIGGRAHLFAQMLPRRRLANRFSAWAIAMMSRTAVSDSQSGFRLYSAHLLRTIELRADGFDMESEVIVRAGLAGLKVVTIPIGLGFVDGIPTSHYKPLADTLRIASTVIRTRLFR